MKVFNVKKLAAIAAGAVLVGSALAPIASGITLTKSDVFDSAGNAHVDVVVGSNAAISDVVWAGNIAAKIASKASTKTPVTCSATGTCEGSTPDIQGLTVDLTVGGTVTFEDAKTYKNVVLDSESGAQKEVEITRSTQTGYLSDSQLSHLYNKSTTYKYGGSNTSVTMKEYIGINADARFDYTHNDVEDLVLFLQSEGDFNYTIDLGTGIPLVDGNLGSGVKFTDGSDDNIKIPVFGQEYLVQELDATGTDNYIKLILNKGKVTYNVGDEITGDIEGDGLHAGEEMTVTFDQLTQSSGTGTYQATLSLWDSAGALVDTQTVSAGAKMEDTFEDGNGDDALKTAMTIEVIAGIVNSDGTISGYIEVLKGTNVIEMYDKKGFPYDSSNTTGIYDWKVKMGCDDNCITATGGDNNKLVSISIVNANKQWNDDNPIYARIGALTTAGQDGKHEAVFLEGEETSNGYGYASVQFDGLEQDEALTFLSIAETCGAPGGAGCIKYTDSSGSSHDIPFYIKLSDNTTSSFVFDTKTIYYKASRTESINGNTTGVDVNISTTATNLNGVSTKVFVASGENNRMVIATNNGVNKAPTALAALTSDKVDINGVTYNVKDNNAGITKNVTMTLTADGNVQFSTAAISSSGASDFIDGSLGTTNLNNTWYYDDGNTANGMGPFRTNMVQLTGANSQTYNYSLFVTESYGHVWLLLEGSTNFTMDYSGDFNLMGTDSDKNFFFFGDGQTAVVENQSDLDMNPFYLPDDLEFGGDSTDNDFYVATFNVEGDGNNVTLFDARVYVDTSTDELISLPNNNLSPGYTSDVNYNFYQASTTALSGGANGEMETWSLRMDSPSSYMSKAYDDFGTKYEITTSAPYVFKMWKPQNVTKPIIVVKGTGTTTTTSGGESFTGLDVGETVTTNNGTQITIDDIQYTSASCVAVGDATGTPTCTATPSTAWTPGNVGTLVYTDNTAVAGPHVVVGGHLVNSMARNVVLSDGRTLQDALQSPGNWVSQGPLADGSFIVAGYNGKDTGSAAQDFINALDLLA
jgi:S-layer protein (TIGR01564 family)